MPSLSPTAKLANLKRSFDVYVAANIEQYFQPPDGGINWQGVRFEESGFKEWAEPEVLGPARLGVGRAHNSTERIGATRVIAQVHIFNRPAAPRADGTLPPAHRIHQLRDAVAGAMPEGSVIAVKDYEGDVSTIGYLIARRVSMDARVAAQELEDLQQWTYAVECEWTEEYTSP